MHKLYSAREIVNALKRAGFVVISQRGSHIKLKGLHNGKIQMTIVPNHKTVAIGTFSSILKQADMTRSEFEDHL